MLSLSGVDTAVTCLSDGGVVSMVKEFTDRALLALLALSVTVIVQFEYVVPSFRALKVIVLLSAAAAVVELLQLPPYVIVPASFEENV